MYIYLNTYVPISIYVYNLTWFSFVTKKPTIVDMTSNIELRIDQASLLEVPDSTNPIHIRIYTETQSHKSNTRPSLWSQSSLHRFLSWRTSVLLTYNMTRSGWLSIDNQRLRHSYMSLAYIIVLTVFCHRTEYTLSFALLDMALWDVNRLDSRMKPQISHRLNAKLSWQLLSTTSTMQLASSTI